MAAAVALAVCLALGGCDARPAEVDETSSGSAAAEDITSSVPQDVASSGTDAADTEETSTETTSEPQPVLASELPEPVTGSYNGQTITMRLAFTPTLDWDELWTYKETTRLRFVNGYAIVSEAQSGHEFYIDRYGNCIGRDKNFARCKPFGEDGRALAELDGGSWEQDPWVYVDRSGEVLGPGEQPPGGSTLDGREEEGGTEVRMFGEPGAYYQQLFDDAGNLLNETKFSRIGYFYHGLALIIQDKKIGLIDNQGNIVIPPTIAYDKTVVSGSVWEYNPEFMDEDLVIAPICGKLAVLEIIRSQPAV